MPGNHFRMNGRNQRTQARVRKLALLAQFYLAISSVTGGHQCRIGKTTKEADQETGELMWTMWIERLPATVGNSSLRRREEGAQRLQRSPQFAQGLGGSSLIRERRNC
jgi:hypothetical protein